MFMWTEIHSQNKNIVRTHDDFIAGKKSQGSEDNKTSTLTFDEACSVSLCLHVLKWSRLHLLCPLLGPIEASASGLGCGSGAYLKVSKGSHVSATVCLRQEERSKHF